MKVSHSRPLSERPMDSGSGSQTTQLGTERATRRLRMFASSPGPCILEEQSQGECHQAKSGLIHEG